MPFRTFTLKLSSFPQNNEGLQRANPSSFSVAFWMIGFLKFGIVDKNGNGK
jgi:hypothetical protein